MNDSPEKRHLGKCCDQQDVLVDQVNEKGCRQSGGGQKEEAGGDECPEVSSECMRNDVVENPIMKNPTKEAFHAPSRSR